MATGATGPMGPITKTFYVSSRRTSPIFYTTVEAPSRDDAIQMTIATCPEGDQIEILQVQEDPFPGAEAAPKDAKAKDKEK
jgi:hypothetical protein